MEKGSRESTSSEASRVEDRVGMEDNWIWKESEFSTYSVNFAYIF